MEEQRHKSIMNDALGFLSRCNWWWLQSEIARIENNAFNWHNALKVLRSNLYDDMKEKEKEEIKLIETRCDEVIYRHINKINRTGNNSVSPDVYYNLRIFDDFLRNIWRQAGYKTKFEEQMDEEPDDWG